MNAKQILKLEDAAVTKSIRQMNRGIEHDNLLEATEAVDELSVISMHTDSRQVRMRCQKAMDAFGAHTF